jgi:hypothetical protein
MVYGVFLRVLDALSFANDYFQYVVYVVFLHVIDAQLCKRLLSVRGVWCVPTCCRCTESRKRLLSVRCGVFLRVLDAQSRKRLLSLRGVWCVQV